MKSQGISKVTVNTLAKMKAEQRKLYNDLKQHYRNSLLKRIETDGLAKSKIMVLEALLRLRQAACHPGLIDRRHAGVPSAKFEALLPQLAEVREEGHKALVFSQFTSLLALLRPRLEPLGLVDGKLIVRGLSRMTHG